MENTITDKKMIRQYIDINFPNAELKGQNVSYGKHNKRTAITITNLIYELNQKLNAFEVVINTLQSSFRPRVKSP